MSWIQLFKYIKCIHILGFVGSIVKGETICGGSTEPTLPIYSIDPLASLSIIVLLMKFTKRLQLLALLNTIAGGKFASYCTPQKVPLKGLIYLLMLTPFSSQLIISILSGESLKINFHSSKFLCNWPDKKVWSFLKDKFAIFGYNPRKPLEKTSSAEFKFDTIGYHRNYSGRWLVATMSASNSISLMRDFTSLPEFDLMFMFAVKSYLHPWCFQCSSTGIPISNCLTVFACIIDSGRLFHISTILTTKVYFLTFSLLAMSPCIWSCA